MGQGQRVGQDHVRGLLDAVMAVTEDLSLDAVLQRIVRSACQLVGARYGALAVIGPDHGLGQILTHGMPSEVAARIGRLPQGAGLLGALLLDPRPLRLREIADHPQSCGFPPHHPPMHSFLGVPIRVRGEVFGNLYLTEKDGGEEFTAEDEELVTALAASAGAAIANARLFAQAQHRETWLEASVEIMRQMLAGVSRLGALRLITERARHLSGSDVAGVVLLQSDGTLRVEAASGPGTAPLCGVVVTDDFPWGAVGRGGGTVIIEDLESQPHMHRPPSLPPLGPALFVPMAAGEQVLGTLVLARTADGARYGGDDVSLASAFAGHAALALELSRGQEDRTRLAVYEDRDRIARDLHDVVIQHLFAAGLSLHGLRKHLPEEVQGCAEELADDLDEAMRELRTAIYSLQQPGGPTAVRTRVLQAAAAAAPSLGFEPQVRMEGPLDTVVPDPVATHLVAVLTEALSNAARHAGSRRVVVAVTAADGTLTALVSDDGVGFGQSERLSGLANLRTRALHLGGSFEVDSECGRGTRLVWRVPLPS